MILGDKAIRTALLNFLNARVPPPTAIIEELRVHNGNAIADVVALYKDIHCFEIKGENDHMSRIARQAEFYNTSFPKITLVTTTQHISSAEKLIPDYWGILIAKNSADNVTFSYYRKAKHNKNINIIYALSMLWKSELLTLANEIESSDIINKQFTRAKLAHYISEHKNRHNLIKNLSSIIENRYKSLNNS